MSVNPRILLTGFSSFPGAPLNPTKELMRLHQKTASYSQTRAIIFPTSYRIISKYLNNILESVQPDIVLSFGLAYEAKGVRLETSAYNNSTQTSADIEDAIGPDIIRKDSPRQLDTTFPVSELMTVLGQNRYTAEISSNPGRYVCNYLYYHINHYMRMRDNPGLSLFIHIPPAEEQIIELRNLGVEFSESYCLPMQELFRLKSVIEQFSCSKWLRNSL